MQNTDSVNFFSFYTSNEANLLLTPIVEASEVKMPWVDDSIQFFKSQQDCPNKMRHSATHMCSGIRHLAQSGWILKAPFDFYIETNGDGHSFKWNTPSEKHKIDFFPQEFFGNIAQLPKNTLKTIIKVETTWSVKIPEKWNLMYIPLQYHNETRFTSSIGILNQKHSSEIHAVLFWNVLNGRTLIKAGTPLCQLIPVPVEKINFEVCMSTEKEDKLKQLRDNIQQCKFVNNLKDQEAAYNQYYNIK
jgi:hypothetical protein